jgi:hypothetical protein
MTKVLEEAFAKASALPKAAQDKLGRFLIAEIEAETEWDESFASSQDELARMAREALAEYDAGETKPLDMKRDF